MVNYMTGKNLLESWVAWSELMAPLWCLSPLDWITLVRHVTLLVVIITWQQFQDDICREYWVSEHHYIIRDATDVHQPREIDFWWRDISEAIGTWERQPAINRVRDMLLTIFPWYPWHTCYITIMTSITSRSRMNPYNADKDTTTMPKVLFS